MTTELQRPICPLCGERPRRTHGLRNGSWRLAKSCHWCWKQQNPLKAVLYKTPYLRYRGDRCEECGFVAKHKAQLEVDHIDGNHRNHAPSNLRTLCANCHRLKTMVERGLYQENDPLMAVGA